MSPNADIAQAVIAAVALLAAVWAATISLKAYRTSYRPLVRVIPAVEPGPTLKLTALILKNIGRGAAVSLVIVEGRGANGQSLVAEIDALEPLGELHGPDFVEKSRVGRHGASLARPLVPGSQYRVFYQDVASDWHETEFTVRTNALGFEVRMVGRRQPEEIPSWVRDRAQVVTGL